MLPLTLRTCLLWIHVWLTKADWLWAQVMEVLLEHGADADRLDVTGSCGLKLAAEKNQMRAARTLLKAGASPDVQDLKGATPLMTALQEANEEIIMVRHDSSHFLSINLMVV